MDSARVRNAYQKSEAQADIHPVKLIHLMYERVLTHLDLAEQGVLQNDVKLRGENLSKAIAIISELNAAIKDEDNSEAAEFLRGLYSAILVELPNVGVSNEVEIVRQASRYIQKLKSMWEETAFKEAGLDKVRTAPQVKAKEDVSAMGSITEKEKVSEKKGYSAQSKFKNVKAAPESVSGGLSVSI